ncbi:MAG: HD domain-containing protein [Acidobacteria bacterium]|nr:HD domain-containing protein [Acidobacteriota bacterium]
MQSQMAMITLTDAERASGERLLKTALEVDRVEGYSQPHSIMMAALAERIGTHMGLHGSDLTALKFAALAHDLGERTMKRNYLLRPDPLTWEETLDLWRHPILGEQAASELKLPRQTQLLIRWHHEWWNGNGYPDSLSGESIPLGARILRVVDSWCSLISNRPHRPRFSEAEAEQMIADFAGIEFDPTVASILLDLFAEEKETRNAATPLEETAHETELKTDPASEPVLPFEQSHPWEPELEAAVTSETTINILEESAPESVPIRLEEPHELILEDHAPVAASVDTLETQPLHDSEPNPESREPEEAIDPAAERQTNE